ncbi:malate dehydrogenase (oxaloacetate-decarboxylating) [Luteococcus japonicus]|uniref:Putative malate oxidoreductase [NAD] n=1 Tax=Luteococcus japonicus TaxID=33984 RepID=A0A3N1ZQD6_9ACTN|nr:NAD-dependent malic enzyme [Luteococcus japonicus]ROR53120.1 malate dehydrogenase (oxaloacetate-decarboxylating) [Luteococcus japonicus]
MANFSYVHEPDGSYTLRIAARGREVLTNPLCNFGTAFTRQQRIDLNVNGLLPSNVVTIDQQLKRVYSQYQGESDALAKYVFLNTMQDRNETLFYRLLTEHLEEMLPIVYTPTIGKAIETYSHWYHRPRGIFLSIDDPDGIEPALRSYGHSSEDVDLVVVTDSEGILGIGDQGVGGVAIAVGKLGVYTAAAGIHPSRALPVVLDVGTDNIDLLNDETYLGYRHARVRGARYDEFVDRFVQAIQTMYPHAMIHWEDFGAGNAHRILDKYRDEVCTFNDDVQGTAAVVVAAILAAVRRSGQKLANQRIVVHGAGTAGIGIADLLVQRMVNRGIPREQALSCFYGLGSRGLLREGVKMRDFQEPYARSAEELAGWELDTPGKVELADVVRNVHPTIMIGTSAQAGAFTQRIVKDVASHCEHPILMPLSNPTRKAEALPADLLEWTDGRALIATGSPFEPVHFNGTTYTIAQANNALVFPGLGLGVAACRASRVSDSMILAAAEAVAKVVTSREPGASLLPRIDKLRAVSARVAIAVAKQAQTDGLATVELANPVQDIHERMWSPDYPKVEVV